MPSSGTSPIGTSGDGALTAIAATPSIYSNVVITNTGAAPGFYSLDGGATWNYLTAQVGSVPGGIFLNNQKIINQSLQIKRIAGGTDLSGVYVSLL